MVDRATSHGWQKHILWLTEPHLVDDRVTSGGRQCDAASVLLTICTDCKYATHEYAWTGRGVGTNVSHYGRDIGGFFFNGVTFAAL